MEKYAEYVYRYISATPLSKKIGDLLAVLLFCLFASLTYGLYELRRDVIGSLHARIAMIRINVSEASVEASGLYGSMRDKGVKSVVIGEVDLAHNVYRNIAIEPNPEAVTRIKDAAMSDKPFVPTDTAPLKFVASLMDGLSHHEQTENGYILIVPVPPQRGEMLVGFVAITMTEKPDPDTLKQIEITTLKSAERLSD